MDKMLDDNFNMRKMRCNVIWWKRKRITWTKQQAWCECGPRRWRRTCVMQFMRHGRGICSYLSTVLRSRVEKANKKELDDKKFSSEERYHLAENDY